jgi:hypothetical protein
MNETLAGTLPLSMLRRMRSQLVSGEAGVTGLDHVEAKPAPPRGFQLTLFFLHQMETGEVLLPPRLDPAQLRVVRPDGTPLSGVWVESVARSEVEGEPVYVAALAAEGSGLVARLASDLSQYVLEILGVTGVDRFLSQALFSFSGAPGSAPGFGVAVPDLPPPADIDYLVKDFQSFRKLMLDRMALLLPEWPERNPVDLGVAVVEVLAYAADYLSYYQDSVATEAYLETARERISVRRHVRLLDYILHEGCNARVWLGIRPGAGSGRPVKLPAGTEVLTGGSEEGTVERGSERYQRMIAGGSQVFETLYEASVRPEVSGLSLYAWGLSNYLLPAGSRRATLEGEHRLEAGEVLVLRQALNPESGEATDVDLRLAHAVRLSEPSRQGADGRKPVTEISWHEEDALPFDLWIARKTRSGVCKDLAEVHGNIVLADHGRTICEELPPVPENGSYRPVLTERNLIYSVPFRHSATDALPAQAALAQDPAQALPALRLYEINERYFYQHTRKPLQPPPPGKSFWLAGTYGPALEAPASAPLPPQGDRFDLVFKEALGLLPEAMPQAEVWMPRHDLLESGRFARNFVIETESDGRARLRFGDGTQGLAPDPGSRFWAVYRTGSPPRGNVGPRTVTRLVLESGGAGAGLAGARNDVAAQGGTLPEDIEVARRDAPQAFHIQQRCVTEGDYVTLAERFPGVYKAQCVKSWNGSGTTALVSVQREGGRPVDGVYLDKLDKSLRPFLLLGHEMEVLPPRMIPLCIVFAVEVEPSHLRSTIRDDLLDVLSDRRLLDGRYGFFYPDRFTFGQPVYLSELIATGMRVHGVAAVEALEFHRLGRAQGNELETGRVEMGRLEIAQCRNDSAVPRLGTIELRLTGGQ